MDIHGVKVNQAEAIFIVDAQDTIVTCNTSSEDVFGWPVDKMVGNSFSRMLLPASTRKTFRSLLHSFESQGKQGFLVNKLEQKVLHRDGFELPVEFNFCPIDKEFACSFIITARDIRSRRHQAEVLQQVSQSQQTVNSILNIAIEDYSLDEILLQALEAVLLLNTPKLLNKGAVLLVEEGKDCLVLQAHKGFSKQQVEACTRVPFGTCHCGRAALTGEVQYSECIDDKHDIRLDNIAPHGHYCVPISFGGTVLGVMSLYLQEGHEQNDEEKDVLRAVTNILAGVIKRKKVEIQRHHLIKRQEAMITKIFDEKKLTESIIQSLNAGLMVFDLGGVLVTINPSGRKILRQFADPDANDAESIDWFASIPVVKQMTSAGKPSDKQEEISLLNRKGEERSLQYTIIPWDNSSGRQIGIILLLRDITDTLRIQREMEKMNRLSTVAEIASAVAHEVRNPLAGIKTMSQAIEENCDEGDENKEYVTRIIRQVDRLNDLLTEFFTYAKPGKAKKGKVSMGYIVNEIRQLLKVKLDSKRIILEEKYARGLPHIYVDPDQMHQVFLNLTLNALDAMGRKGKIQISAQKATTKAWKKYAELFPDLKENVEYVAVSFKDNGKGMAPEVAEKAFEPFFTTKSNGSGLGLAIVHRILTENNAFIVADSTQKNGMAFLMMFESAGKEHGELADVNKKAMQPS